MHNKSQFHLLPTELVILMIPIQVHQLTALSALCTIKSGSQMTICAVYYTICCSAKHTKYVQLNKMSRSTSGSRPSSTKLTGFHTLQYFLIKHHIGLMLEPLYLSKMSSEGNPKTIDCKHHLIADLSVSFFLLARK
jgi:hypothetical protein